MDTTTGASVLPSSPLGPPLAGRVCASFARRGVAGRRGAYPRPGRNPTIPAQTHLMHDGGRGRETERRRGLYQSSDRERRAFKTK